MSLTIDAEEAIFGANLIAAYAKRTSKLRRVVTPARERARERVLLELYVARVVGSAEAYLVMAATRKLRPILLMALPPPAPDATSKKLQQAVANFPDLVKVWMNDLNVDPSTGARWNDFLNLRDLRHVVVHRLGYWQPGLDRHRKPSVSKRIALLGIDPDAYRGLVPMSDGDLSEAVDILKEVVRDLDARL